MRKLLLFIILAFYSWLGTAQVKDSLSAPALYLRMEAIRRLPSDLKKATRVASLSKYIPSSEKEYLSFLEEAALIAAAHHRADLLSTLNQVKSRIENNDTSPLHLSISAGLERQQGLRNKPRTDRKPTFTKEALRIAYLQTIHSITESGDRDLLQATKIIYADHLVLNGSNEGIDIFRNLATEVSLSEKDRIHILSQLVIHLFKLNRITEANEYYTKLQQADKEGLSAEEGEESLLATAMYYEYGKRFLEAKTTYWKLTGKSGQLSRTAMEAVVHLAALYSRLFRQDSARFYFNIVQTQLQTLPRPLQYEYTVAYNEYQQRFQNKKLVTDLKEALQIQDSQYQRELVKATQELSLQNQVLETNRKLRQVEHQQQINNLQQANLRQRFTLLVVVLCLVVLLAISISYVIFLRKKQATLLLRKEMEQLKEKHRNDVLQVLTRAQESERSRIAGQLHDEIGSMLSVIRLNLSSVKEGSFYSPNEQVKMDTTQKLLGEISTSIREMSHQLMPVAIREYGLRQAIRQLVADINTSGKLFVEEVIVGMEEETSWPEEFCLGLYRIVQELLQNSVKHSGADRALVQVVEHEDLVSILVEDNGKGILPNTEKGGKGLQILHSRVEYFKGKMNIENGSEGGLLVCVELPLKKAVA